MDLNVLMINGSPRVKGNTTVALAEMEKIFAAEGIACDTVQMAGNDVRGCIACGHCSKGEGCVFDDLVNETAPKFAKADGLVVAAPVYYGSANGSVVSFLDRLFYSTGSINKTMKVGCAVAVARRGGLSATYDELNKYFAISGMPIATGQYWNGVFGAAKGEAAQDREGMQQMRTLARNMAFLMKSIALGKKEFGVPEKEPFERMNFIR